MPNARSRRIAGGGVRESTNDGLSFAPLLDSRLVVERFDAGDVGIPMRVQPRDDKVAGVLPIGGSEVWPRVCPGGRRAV